MDQFILLDENRELTIFEMTFSTTFLQSDLSG
jgi:hypothetical protein